MEGFSLPEVDNVVQVKARVDIDGSIDCFSPKVATWFSAIRSSRDWTFWWIRKRIAHELVVAAFNVLLV